MRTSSALFLTLITACSVGGDGPATPASPSAVLSAQAGQIGVEAEALRVKAASLESLTDESRRRVAAGESTPAEEIEKMRALMAEIQADNEVLQAHVQALEADAHTRAGDVAPVVEPDEG